MQLVYNKKDNYYLINDLIKIDVETSIAIAKLKNTKECLKLIDDEWIYIYYKSNIKLISIIFPNEKIVSYCFLNDDINDYRKSNIIIETDNRYDDVFVEPCNVTILKNGTSNKISHGKFSGQYRNMYWKVKSEEVTYYMMHISNSIYTKISKRDIKKIINYNGVRPFWYLHSNGYIGTTTYPDKHQFYLHQYIMDVHTEDNTNYEKTVDHINCDKLDNRQSNLRFANMSEQNENRAKTARRCDAKIELPEWLTVLPKYVQYRQEIYNKETNSMRDFFIIMHPKADKMWESSKSMNISLLDKFKATKLQLQLFDGLISESEYKVESGENKIIDLPLGIRILEKNNKYTLIYDYRTSGNRYNIKRTISTKSVQNELSELIKDINIKYKELKISDYTINNTYACKLIEKHIIEPIQYDVNISDEIKHNLPKNFIITSEKINDKITKYLAFTKRINGKKYNMKMKIVSDDINSLLDELIVKINKKFNLHP
jgi:hypothetical protein